MRKKFFCGVDLHSNNAMYVITDQQDKLLLKKRLPNQLPVVLESLEPFRKQLKVVAVESTYNWYWLVDGLMDHEYPVVLANPSAIDQYDGIKEANDLTDAAFLARLARLDILPTGYIYPREDRPVRDLLRRRTLIVKQRTAIIQSLQNMAMRQTGQSISWRVIRKLSDEERTEFLGDHDCLAFVTTEQADLIQLLKEKSKRFKEKVLEHAHLKPAYECLLTIPGVGVRTGEAVVAYMDDPRRFSRNKSVGTYFGLVPCQDASAGKNRFGRITREGPATVRRLLVQAAWQAIRRSPEARAFFERVQHDDPERKKKAIVATAHYLVRAMHAMLRSGEAWRTPAA